MRKRHRERERERERLSDRERESKILVFLRVFLHVTQPQGRGNEVVVKVVEGQHC